MSIDLLHTACINCTRNPVNINECNGCTHMYSRIDVMADKKNIYLFCFIILFTVAFIIKRFSMISCLWSYEQHS